MNGGKPLPLFYNPKSARKGQYILTLKKFSYGYLLHFETFMLQFEFNFLEHVVSAKNYLFCFIRYTKRA